MDFGDVDACPGLNLKHGFLRSINQRLTLSHDNMVQEKEQIKQEKANMKEVEDKTKKKKPRRPTIELYSIPARRKGGDPQGQLTAVIGRRGSCSALNCERNPDKGMQKDLITNASRNGGKCDKAVESNCSCTNGNSDFLELRGSEVQETGVKQDEHGFPSEEHRVAEAGARPCTQIRVKEHNIRALPLPDVKPGKVFGSLDTCRPSSCLFGFSREMNYTSLLRANTSIQQKAETTCDENSGSIAEHTLRKLLRKKPKEGHALYIKILNPGVQVEGPTLLSQGVSDLVVKALEDTSSVSDAHLQRIAEVLVANSSISELFSYRMRYIVMFILKKEKESTIQGSEGRFVNALLEACQNEKGKNKNVSVSTGLPFLNFVSVMYCCNVFHQETARLMCAQLIYSHIHAFIKVSSDALQAEQIFYLLKKVGPLLEIDVPSQMYQLYITVKEKFLSNESSEMVKDVLLDIIEARAAGWKTV